MAWLLARLKVEVLGWLGLLLGAVVAIRLLFNPDVLHYPLGDMVVFNWILYGYGIPCAAFVLAHRWYGEARWDQVSKGFGWGAWALGLALMTLEVRHGFHPTELLAGSPGPVEWSTYSSVWIGAALLLLAIHRRNGKDMLRYTAAGYLIVAIVKICAVDLLFANPLWDPHSVGTWPILNWLLYIFLTPALGLLAADRLFRGWRISMSSGAGFSRGSRRSWGSSS